LQLFSDALMSHAINTCLEHLVPLFRDREQELPMAAKTIIFDALNLVVPVLHVRFLPKIRALIGVDGVTVGLFIFSFSLSLFRFCCFGFGFFSPFLTG
jgi:hypothetical protein